MSRVLEACSQSLHVVQQCIDMQVSKGQALRGYRNAESIEAQLGKNPWPQMFLPTELLSRVAVGKVYIATKLTSSTCQCDLPRSNCNHSLEIRTWFEAGTVQNLFSLSYSIPSGLLSLRMRMVPALSWHSAMCCCCRVG